jgi:hypothetical protein
MMATSTIPETSARQRLPTFFITIAWKTSAIAR